MGWNVPCIEEEERIGVGSRSLFMLLLLLLISLFSLLFENPPIYGDICGDEVLEVTVDENISGEAVDLYDEYCKPSGAGRRSPLARSTLLS